MTENEADGEAEFVYQPAYMMEMPELVLEQSTEDLPKRVGGRAIAP